MAEAKAVGVAADKAELATQVDRTSNTASSRPSDSNRKLSLRLPEHRKSLTGGNSGVSRGDSPYSYQF